MSASAIIWSEPGRYGEAYVLVLTTDDEGIDLSQTTAATLRARDPAGNEHEWVAEFKWDDEAEELTITYAFEAGDDDVTRAGQWGVYAELEHGDDTPWRSKPRTVIVRERFAVVP